MRRIATEAKDLGLRPDLEFYPMTWTLVTWADAPIWMLRPGDGQAVTINSVHTKV